MLIVHEADGASVAPQLVLCSWKSGPETLIAEMLRTASPLLVRLAVLARVDPTTTWPKLSEFGERNAMGWTPVPEIGMLVEPPLYCTTTDEESVPSTAGLKVTLIVQLAAAPSDAGQLFVCAKGELAEMLVIVNGEPEVEVLVMVIICAALVVPMRCEKLRLAGLTEITGSPTPDRVTTVGVVGGLFEIIDNVPLAVPLLVGLNVSPIVQLALGASETACKQVPET